MTKPGFTWTTPILCVDNVAKSLEHYQSVLGFDIAWQWGDDEKFDGNEPPTFACVTRGEVSVFLGEQRQGNPGSWVFLNVSSKEDLNRIHEEYKKSGADIAEPPEDCPWGMREMLVRDPDGNCFRIGCSLE